MDSSKTLTRFTIQAFVITILVLFYAPLAWTCMRAFFHGGGVSLFWFQELFSDPSFFLALRNSLGLAVGSSVLSVLLSLVAVLAVPKPKVSGFYDRMMAVTLSLPEIVLALSLLSYFSFAGIQLGFLSAWIAHTTLTLAFSYWVLSVQYNSLDSSLLEAGQDLGADTKTLILQIALPQMKPSIISSFWICFLISLDDFLISFFVSGSSYETLPLKLFSMIKVGLNPKVNALSFLILVVSSLILVGLYGLWNKRNQIKD